MKLGILGGGQLARMLALAGYPLGQRYVFFDPSAEACAGQVGELYCASYDDERQLEAFANAVDCVTFEFENVSLDSARFLERHVPVYPTAEALAATQDRLTEKSLFQRLGIQTPGFMAVSSLADLRQAVEQLGLPLVLKTRRFGYDGKGQFVVKAVADIDAAWKSLGGVPLIAEAFVPFTREVSVVAVRGRGGDVAFYPLTENEHRQGILHLSRARAEDVMTAQAQDYAKRLLDELNYVGVLALELFQVDDQLLANEFAPRVHNSGHWTIEGAETSQFENHVRAVSGLPLGSTRVLGPVAMLNIIGTFPQRDEVLQVAGAHWHDYGKAPREGRKIGHITLTAPTEAELEANIAQVAALLS